MLNDWPATLQTITFSGLYFQQSRADTTTQWQQNEQNCLSNVKCLQAQLQAISFMTKGPWWTQQLSFPTVPIDLDPAYAWLNNNNNDYNWKRFSNSFWQRDTHTKVLNGWESCFGKRTLISPSMLSLEAGFKILFHCGKPTDVVHKAWSRKERCIIRIYISFPSPSLDKYTIGQTTRCTNPR